jgi:hypothetical protein
MRIKQTGAIVHCDGIRKPSLRSNMAGQAGCKQNRFSRIFGRQSTPASSAPPPYSGNSDNELKTEKLQAPPPPPPPPEDQFPDINALSVPQWTWTNEQCREWLRKFLVTQCGCSVEYAVGKAGKLEGFGANIYLRRFKAWEELLGFVDADGIYALAIGYRNMDGVVPHGVGFNHPKKENKKK